MMFDRKQLSDGTEVNRTELLGRQFLTYTVANKAFNVVLDTKDSI